MTLDPFAYHTADKDPVEDSPSLKDPGAEGDGNTPEGGDTPSELGHVSNALEDRIVALERNLLVADERNIDLAANNAVLRGKDKEQEQTLSREDFKKFGLENDGKQQVDASIHYTDQVVRGLEEKIKTSLRQDQRAEATADFAKDYMLEVYPEFADPNSEFTKKVLAEQSRILAKGSAPADDQGARQQAMSLALHRVGNTHTGTTDGETESEFRTRRRIESSGAEGAPVANGKKEDPGDTITKAELAQLTKDIGHTPSKEGIATFLNTRAEYAKRRTR